MLYCAVYHTTARSIAPIPIPIPDASFVEPDGLRYDADAIQRILSSR